MLDRLQLSLKRVNNPYPVLAWRDVWPPDSMPHEENFYGFKCYAFEEARRQGFTSILWLDSQVIAVRPVERIFEFMESNGLYICGGRLENIKQDKLVDLTPEALYVKMAVTKEECACLSLMCGCAIGVNFKDEDAAHWYETWNAACQAYYFFVGGRRGDEAVGSIIADKLGLNKRLEDSVHQHFLQACGSNLRTADASPLGLRPGPRIRRNGKLMTLRYWILFWVLTWLVCGCASFKSLVVHPLKKLHELHEQNEKHR
jgi:hypothetical protein